jgi:cytochrome c oxidase subunit 2
VTGFHLLPPSLSAYARDYDLLFAGMLGIFVLLVTPVFVAVVYFAAKYRAGSRADRTQREDRNVWIEVSWSAIPFAITLVFFVWAARMYIDEQSPPDGALVITVLAKQWMWKFQHPTGQREIDTLHVPMGQTIVLDMISEDVIHSLYFPSLRIKQDVLPGRYTRLWFRADETGDHHLLCAEFCGTSHSEMGGRIIVMKPEDYAQWLDQAGTDQDIAAEGQRLFRSHGCSGCHVDSDVVHAPSLRGLYGGPVPLSDGRIVTADDRYLRDSILLPLEDVVAGYKPVMPSFTGQLDEGQILALIAYIKSLGTRKEFR